jgi:putative transposase
MGTARFAARTLFVLDHRQYRLERLVNQDTWVAIDQTTLRPVEFTCTQLRIHYLTGKLRFFDPAPAQKSEPARKASEVALAILCPNQMLVAKHRRAYVEGIKGLALSPIGCTDAIHKIWERIKYPEKPPGFSTVAHWHKKYHLAGRSISALIDTKVLRRKGRIRPEVIQAVQEAVDAKYMKLERGSVQDAFDDALLRVNDENQLRTASDQLPLPTYSLVRRIVRAIPAFDRYAARHGLGQANVHFRAALRVHTVEHPLERAEIDHTRLDLMAVDEISGLPLGRPYLTICIDVCTRCILGLYVGFEPASFLTVGYCLKDALRPKTNLSEEYPEIRHSWEAHGVMTTLVVDNGAEFHSEALESACYTLGIDIEYCTRKSPWLKPHVERYFRSMNEGITHRTPGTTFSNIFDKDEYDPEKHAIVTLKTLRTILRKWVVDYYHQRTHSSLQTSPAAKWAASISPEDIPVPADPEALDAIIGRPESRVLTHAGLKVDGLRYGSTELNGIRRTFGPKLTVDVSVDESDLGSVVVIRPDQSGFIRVPCLEKAYASHLTRWQHTLCKRFAASNIPNEVGPLAWAKAKQEIAQIVEEDRATTKGRRRLHGRAQRWADNGKDAAAIASPGALPIGDEPEKASRKPKAPTKSDPPKASPATTRRFAPMTESGVYQDVEKPSAIAP